MGGGKPLVLPKDNCPNGDTSPTQYDSLCSGMSPSNGTLAVTGDSTTGTVTTGTVISTGNITT